jgi:hypothetical protein
VKDASIMAHFELSDGFNKWNASFVRAADDWEVDVFAPFFSLLYSVRVRWVLENKEPLQHIKNISLISSPISFLIFLHDFLNIFHFNIS